MLKFTLGEAHTSSGVGQKGFGGKAPWRLLHLTFPRAFVKHGPWAMRVARIPGSKCGTESGAPGLSVSALGASSEPDLGSSTQ